MSGGTDEPNLVPLLDLILQLVMFFMACTNFARENISEAIKLPLAQKAMPLEDEEIKSQRLFLNVEDTGDLRVRPVQDSTGTQWFTGGRIDSKTPLTKEAEGLNEIMMRRKNLDFYFTKVHDIYADFEARAQRKPAYKQLSGKEKDEVDKAVADKTIVVLRGHQQSSYMDVYDILNRSRRVGFSRLQLRAIMDNK